MTTSDLMRRVCNLIFGTPYYKKVFKIECLFWRTVHVEIDDILFNEFQGPRTPHGFIGGSEKCPDNCAGLYWYPPTGSHLFRIFQEAVSGVLPLEKTDYFLLVTEEKYCFLKRTMGEEDSLTVLGIEDNDDTLRRVLERVLSEIDFDYCPQPAK